MYWVISCSSHAPGFFICRDYERTWQAGSWPCFPHLFPLALAVGLATSSTHSLVCTQQKDFHNLLLSLQTLHTMEKMTQMLLVSHRTSNGKELQNILEVRLLRSSAPRALFGRI